MRNAPPDWDPREPDAQVLMEYLKRASPEFIAAELQQQGLLEAADAAADHVLETLAARGSQLEEDQLARCLEVVLEQHGIQLADEAPRPRARRWRAPRVSMRSAASAAAIGALMVIVLAVDSRWGGPALPQGPVRERIYKQYAVLHNPVTEGVRHGVDEAALRQLGRGLRERGIDAAQLEAGASVALEYEVLLEPATGQARFAGLISASVDGRDLQLAQYAAGEGLRAKEGL